MLPCDIKAADTVLGNSDITLSSLINTLLLLRSYPILIFLALDDDATILREETVGGWGVAVVLRLQLALTAFFSSESFFRPFVMSHLF